MLREEKLRRKKAVYKRKFLALKQQNNQKAVELQEKTEENTRLRSILAPLVAGYHGIATIFCAQQEHIAEGFHLFPPA